ncbi:hypothetical protein [Nannocystis sp.]|uniref:hypothetical protein n=1 Tax=Nannocystis sp. TaxID=1962667 RepID=UPI0025F8122A|nr:hypothetical protein [Nannocystis sp.]MBK7830433.1 hypothetical protein [Nannocystis sp.]
MVGLSGLLLAWSLALSPGGGGSASQPGCPGWPRSAASSGWSVPEALAGLLEAAWGPELRCGVAADRVATVYRALLVDPQRRIEGLHALLGDAVNLYVAAHRETRERTLICRADELVLRHRDYVRGIEATTVSFEQAIARVRTLLHAHLREWEYCPTIDPGMVTLARRQVLRMSVSGDRLLRPGELLAATRDRRPPRPSGRQWQAAKRGGVVMMAVGLMVLGGGIAVGAAERLPRRDLLQGGLLVSGTALFVGAFPLIIVADQRVRATLAIGAGGAALRF